jgi:hypothetical protein
MDMQRLSEAVVTKMETYGYGVDFFPSIQEERRAERKKG